MRRPSAERPSSSRSPARRVGVGEPVKAEAAQRPALAPLRAAARRWPRRPACWAWKAVSKQATAGTPGRAALTGVERGQRLRLMQRRQIGERRAACARHASSTMHRLEELGAAVHDAVADGVHLAEAARARPVGAARVGDRRAAPAGRGEPARWSVASSSRSFRLLEPALTTSMRSVGSLAARPLSCAVARSSPPDLGRVLAVLARVGARQQAPVGHVLAHVAGPRRQAGHAVDHVHHQVEAVQVVEHDHVEGRRGGALLLVAAHVDVVVVGAPVGEAVDQPGIAVVGEDHRPVGGEQRVELGVARGRGGARSGGCRRIRSTTLTTRTFRSGRCWRRMVGGGQRLQRGHVAAAAPARRRARRPGRCWPTPRCRCRACSAAPPPPWSATAAAAACRPRSR